MDVKGMLIYHPSYVFGKTHKVSSLLINNRYPTKDFSPFCVKGNSNQNQQLLNYKYRLFNPKTKSNVINNTLTKFVIKNVDGEFTYYNETVTQWDNFELKTMIMYSKINK